MTTQIEVRGDKNFDDVNRNYVYRGGLNRSITVVMFVKTKKVNAVNSSITLYGNRAIRNLGLTVQTRLISSACYGNCLLRSLENAL